MLKLVPTQTLDTFLLQWVLWLVVDSQDLGQSWGLAQLSVAAVLDSHYGRCVSHVGNENVVLAEYDGAGRRPGSARITRLIALPRGFCGQEKRKEARQWIY